MKGAATQQKRNYDRKAKSSDVKEGVFVWLHNPAQKRGHSPKLSSPWEGPYLVITKLSDVVYRIQAKPKGKMLVVHADCLKLYEGDIQESWISPNVFVDNSTVAPKKFLCRTPANVRRNQERPRRMPLRYL